MSISSRPPPSRLTVGDRLPGTKYVLVRELGVDESATLYEVVKNPGIKGALKLLNSDLAKRSEYCQRFFEEARILAQLKHRNLVQVIDYDQLLSGVPFYVMELLVGKTLRQTLRDAGKIDPAVVFEIQHQILEGLYRAHASTPPSVHGDIKPENIFLHVPEHDAPCVKILGFGRATFETVRDKSGRTLLAPKYSAPEQLRGESISPRTDLYAAGLLLYEMLCGRGPFEEYVSSEQMMEAHIRVLAPSIRKFAPWVPESIDRLLASALAKSPRERPEDAYAFAAQLYDLQFLGEAEIAAHDARAPHATVRQATVSAPWGVVPRDEPVSQPAVDTPRDPSIEIHIEEDLSKTVAEHTAAPQPRQESNPTWARMQSSRPPPPPAPPSFFNQPMVVAALALLIVFIGVASLIAVRDMGPKELSEKTAGDSGGLFDHLSLAGKASVN